MFRFGLWLKLRFIAMSMVSWSGILVKKTSYMVGNKKFIRKICVLNLRSKRKGIFARVIIRYYVWKEISKETGKMIIRSTYRWSNRRKFRKCINGGKLAHFRSTIDTSSTKNRRIEFIIFIFIRKVFLFQLPLKTL